MDLEQRGERWERVWGVAKNYNCAAHTGRVMAAQLTGPTARISLETNIRHDSFAPGSRAKQQRNGREKETSPLTRSHAPPFARNGRPAL